MHKCKFAFMSNRGLCVAPGRPRLTCGRREVMGLPVCRSAPQAQYPTPPIHASSGASISVDSATVPLKRALQRNARRATGRVAGTPLRC